MSAKIDFLYLSEPDMIKAGVKDMGKCVEVMEDMMVTLKKGDYVMGGENHNSHGCMVTFPDNPEFEGMPKPDHTAPCSAANLWSCGVTSFMKYLCTIDRKSTRLNSSH